MRAGWTSWMSMPRRSGEVASSKDKRSPCHSGERAQAHQTPRAVDGQRMRHSSNHRRPSSRPYYHTYRRHAELYRCANEREAAGSCKGPQHPLPCMKPGPIPRQFTITDTSHSSLTVTRKLASLTPTSNTLPINTSFSSATSSASSPMPVPATTSTALRSAPRSPLP
jgi:hypothetical protein